MTHSDLMWHAYSFIHHLLKFLVIARRRVGGVQGLHFLSIYESRHTYEISCQTSKWVLSRINDSCHTWVSQNTRMNASCRRSKALYFYCSCMSHATCVIESCHIKEWVMSQKNESCRMDESCHIWKSHGWVMSWGKESCHTYEWVMSHIWMSHVTHMNESCHAYEW